MKTGSGVRIVLAALVVAIAVTGVVFLISARFAMREPLGAAPASESALPTQGSPQVGGPDAPALAASTANPGELGLDPRTRVTYTVAAGDTLFSIAGKFALEAETLYWANEQAILVSENLSPRVGAVLVIPPADGVYYEWAAGDHLEQVAGQYGVAVEAIVSWPQNRLPAGGSPDGISEALAPGALLFVPGGQPEIAISPVWSSLGISRADPGVGEALGAGFCEGGMSGSMGAGSFGWPVQASGIISYDSLGAALFIASREGAAVLAADSGVVVFSGALDPGPGHAVILDHGPGWQTYYGNLAAVSVACGESVQKGAVVGSLALNDTRGAFLQFEAYNRRPVLPLEVLPELVQ
jgi:murein DD-endopeptidase MepM/ murein hydrolase activator NlpD